MPAIQRYLAEIAGCERTGEEIDQGVTLDTFSISYVGQCHPHTDPVDPPSEIRRSAGSSPHDEPLRVPQPETRRMPLWSEALRLAGWNATDDDIHRTWLRLLTSTTPSAREEAG